MNQLPSHQPCPVNLGYTEPAPPHLDVSGIVRRGRALRRRRRYHSLGVLDAASVASAPGGPVVVWVACAASPVPRFPVVTPAASGR
jgi:hypothetical protein